MEYSLFKGTDGARKLPVATTLCVMHSLNIQAVFRFLFGADLRLKQMLRNRVSHRFQVNLEHQGPLVAPLGLGFPSPLWVQQGQLWAAHPWSGNLHHQEALVFLSPLEDPSGLRLLVHPNRHTWVMLTNKTMTANLHSTTDM